MLFLDKDDSSWEVMSAVSLTSHKGHNRVMTRLLKKSNQLVMVLDGIVGTTFSCNLCRNVFFGMIIFIKMQEDAPLVMVRLRVVKLLGHLGGKINRNLVTGNLFLLYFAMLAKRAILIGMLSSCLDHEFVVDHCPLFF